MIHVTWPLEGVLIFCLLIAVLVVYYVRSRERKLEPGDILVGTTCGVFGSDERYCKTVIAVGDEYVLWKHICGEQIYIVQGEQLEKLHATLNDASKIIFKPKKKEWFPA